MIMGNLWQFFGLPDPDASVVSTKSSDSKPQRAGQTLTNEPTESLPVVEEPLRPAPQVEPVLEWNGPVTPDGEPFHDLFLEPRRQRRGDAYAPFCSQSRLRLR